MIAGDKAPDFTLYDHTGRPRTLSALLSEGPVVLFFFPIASSPICTAQACHFRDLSNEFATVGAQRVGISTDTVDKQAHFAQQRSFDYPLLSDADGVVSELFGVRRGRLAKLCKSVVARETTRRGRHSRRRGLLARLLPVRRTTFVIDTDRTVLKVISSELRASVHADQTLWFLQHHKGPHSSPHVREKHTDAHKQSEGEGEPIGDWFTEPETTDEPRLVRPHALTTGRTDSGVELPLETPVEARHHSEAAALAEKRCAGPDPEVLRAQPLGRRDCRLSVLSARCDAVPGRRPSDTGLFAGARHSRRLDDNRRTT